MKNVILSQKIVEWSVLSGEREKKTPSSASSDNNSWELQQVLPLKLNGITILKDIVVH